MRENDESDETFLAGMQTPSSPGADDVFALKQAHNMALEMQLREQDATIASLRLEIEVLVAAKVQAEELFVTAQGEVGQCACRL